MSSPSIVETTSNKVLNANGFSILCSIGIHALVLGIALPGISVFSAKEKSTGDRNVGLIELNETEQSRLPNFSQPSIDVPAYRDLNALDNTLANPSSFPSSLPDSIAALPPPPASSLPSVPFDNNIPIAIPPRSMLPAPPPNALPAPPPQQYSYQTPPNTSIPNESARPNFEAPREAIDPRDLINQRIPTFSQNTTPSENVERPTQTATAPRKWQSAPRVNPAEVLREQRIRRLVAESIQGAESLMADKTNTTNEEAMKNDVNWRAKVGQAKPQEIAIVGNYPRAACMRKLEGQTVYGVMVDNSGRVVNSPYRPFLIKSAGYPILNQQALKEVRASSFPNQTGAPQAYQITVDFKFNEKICPSLAVASPEFPTNESKPSNTSKPPSETLTPPPVAPQNEAETTEVTQPNKPASEAVNSEPTSPREVPQTSETTKPEKPASESPSPAPVLRKKPETTESEKPAASEALSPTPIPRKKPEITAPNQPPSEAVNELTIPKKAPEAIEETIPKPKPNRDNPAPTSFRKPSETRPLGISAPKKPRRDESKTKTPSEASRRESQREDER